MYKTILLPIDLADESSTAKLLTLARDLAQSSKAELCVMTVVPEDLSVRRKDDVLTNAQRRLRELTDQGLAGQRVKHVIAYGSADQEILRVAREIGADLVIIGSHKPRARDLLLGSTATQVVRRATSSVLVVR